MNFFQDKSRPPKLKRKKLQSETLESQTFLGYYKDKIVNNLPNKPKFFGQI
jgi:hypothetical protein